MCAFRVLDLIFNHHKTQRLGVNLLFEKVFIKVQGFNDLRP